MPHRETSISIADAKGERGTALVVVLLSMMLLAALGIALSLTIDTETRIAATYEWSTETLYAADAAVERAIQELTALPDWTPVLAGAVTSTMIDGSPGPRLLSDGSRLDLNEQTDLLNCGHLSCSAADLAGETADRPWGLNNPEWKLYGHAPLASIGSSTAVESRTYVVVWVADDPLENDGQPRIDGDETHGPNRGAGLMQLRAQSYGPFGAHRMIEVTLRRVDSRVNVIAWREIRP
jgi:Tfp pilus assembly protein PilX